MYTLRINTKDSKLIIRKRTAEIKVGASVKRGLKGDPGPQGPQGPQGIQGDPGTTDYNELTNLPDLTLKADITYVDSQDTSVASVAQSNLTAHTSDTANPHNVTKSQVGLSDVPNLDTTAAVANQHTHANKAVLDATTASFTTADESRLDGIEAGAQVNTVTSVAGKTGAVTLAKGDVGLGNVDNTSDANKTISTATQSALDGKANSSHTHATTDLTATGGTTTSFLRKDNTWATPTNTTYSEISEAEIATGTASTARTISGRRAGFIIQSIKNFFSPIQVSGTKIGINKVPENGDLDVDGDIYSNGEKVATQLDYSTSEQDTGQKWVDGKAIYQKTVSTGVMPNTTSKGIAHGITGYTNFISITGWTTNGSIWTPLPYVGNLSPLGVVVVSNNVLLAVSGADILIQTASDRSSYTTSYVTLRYTKA